MNNVLSDSLIFIVNLAVTLAQMGQKVGLLDADVFGKSTTFHLTNMSEPNKWKTQK